MGNSLLGVGSVPRLLPFGAGTNDVLGPTDDNGASDALTPSVPYSFFGRLYRDIIVSVILTILC